MGTLLLDDSSPAYVGGMFLLVRQPEMFGSFDESLQSGERLWWDMTSAEWIEGVAATGRPFYSRLVPGGLDKIAGLAERLRLDARSWTPPVARAQVSSGWLRSSRTARSSVWTGTSTRSRRLKLR